MGFGFVAGTKRGLFSGGGVLGVVATVLRRYSLNCCFAACLLCYEAKANDSGSWAYWKPCIALLAAYQPCQSTDKTAGNVGQEPIATFARISV